VCARFTVELLEGGRLAAVQPRLAAARPRRVRPGACSSQHGHGGKEKGGVWWIGLALRAPRPGTLRPDADRPISAARSKS
jgi:hypothetical protein